MSLYFRIILSHEILLFFTIFLAHYDMFIDFSDFKYGRAVDFEASWAMRRQKKNKIFRWLPSAVSKIVFIKPFFLLWHESPAVHMKGSNKSICSQLKHFPCFSRLNSFFISKLIFIVEKGRSPEAVSLKILILINRFAENKNRNWSSGLTLAFSVIHCLDSRISIKWKIRWKRERDGEKE